MIPVSTIETIQNQIRKVKQHKKGFLTNLFLDIPKHELWIKLGLMKYEEIGETFFFCRVNQEFENLYFVTTTVHDLSNDFESFLTGKEDELFVIDLVGKDIMDLKEIFLNRRFFQYSSLVRMSRIGQDAYDDTPNSLCLSCADIEKSNDVHKLLLEYFDVYAEQLPLIEEIHYLANKNGIIIYSEDSKNIHGFLVYELIGQTSYLRYWFVHPDHREKKIGSALLRMFFKESRNTKRQLFWVIESNENAIKRYKHYGFKKEVLFDYIFINKNIRYEG